MLKTLLVTFTTLMTLLPFETSALPRYAVELNNNRCTACHSSPSGGSLRNVYGKLYGQRNFPASKMSQQELLWMDWRAFYYAPEKPKTTRGGLELMEAVVGIKAPLHSPQQEEKDRKIELVVNHSLTGLGGDRETYLLWQAYAPTEYSLRPQYYQVGRLIPPFGLRSDEHRMYTRIVTRSTWNDFLLGFAIAGDLGPQLHYDLAFSNGEPVSARSGSAGNLRAGQSGLHGAVANLRWNSPWTGLPVMLGLSGASFERFDSTAQEKGDSPWAFSAYALASLTRWTQGRLPMTLSVEFVGAQHMNQGNPDLQAMVATKPDSSYEDYLNALAKSQAQALQTELAYTITPRFELIYRYDEMLLDKNFPADAFKRHGVGFNHWVAGNTILRARYEMASGGHPQSDPDGSSLQDAFWTMLQVSY